MKKCSACEVIVSNYFSNNFLPVYMKNNWAGEDQSRYIPGPISTSSKEYFSAKQDTIWLFLEGEPKIAMKISLSSWLLAIKFTLLFIRNGSMVYLLNTTTLLWGSSVLRLLDMTYLMVHEYKKASPAGNSNGLQQFNIHWSHVDEIMQAMFALPIKFWML